VQLVGGHPSPQPPRWLGRVRVLAAATELVALRPLSLSGATELSRAELIELAAGRVHNG
jgi:hypothetical protein